nr:SDR family oxidoreductase [Jiella sp. LLJ827]
MILGASGLIGESVAVWLKERGHRVVPVARRFTAAQRARFGEAATEAPVVDLSEDALCRLLGDSGADIVVNAIGVLQDGPGGGNKDVHARFVDRLLAAIRQLDRPALLVQISMPGSPEDDRTAFSRTKRQAERAITGSALPHVILRPGFVLAPAAFGGSALLRAAAMLPIRFPEELEDRPFRVADVFDIARTIDVLAKDWQAGRRERAESWDIMESGETCVGEMIDHLAARHGGPSGRLRLPAFLLSLGSRAGDFAGLLGWRPPIRSTALAEMRRGVTGDPRPWAAATGIDPASSRDLVRGLSVSVQERWFARLFLLKGLIFPVLAVFWIVSGLIALNAFDAARQILIDSGFAKPLATFVTLASSLMDIAVGVLVAFRRSAFWGLWAGIAVSLFYMGMAAILTPAMWLEPLGALVKTGPAIVLMLVALAILDER